MVNLISYLSRGSKLLKCLLSDILSVCNGGWLDILSKIIKFNSCYLKYYNNIFFSKSASRS